ncbi:hypothetical protein VTN96DRAFT_3781 [Rasamsonia emersonii]
MASHTFPSTTSLSQTFALALVASTFAPLTLAQNLGTDAPANGTDPSPASSGDAAAENAAGAAGAENSGLSKTSQTIIGVVVGVVVLVAIIAAILFFLAKKRQWDRQAKRYEAMNAYRSSAKYHNARAGRYHELSLRQHRRWAGASVVADSPETSAVKKSPPVEPLLPVYDPSTYHRHQLSSGYGYGYDRGASFDLSRAPARTRYSSTIPATTATTTTSAAAAAAAAAAMPSNQPHYSDTTTTTTPTAAATTTTSSVAPPPYSSHMTNSGSSNGSSETQSPPPAVESGSGSDSGPRPPRRPKPVLARLITDL